MPTCCAAYRCTNNSNKGYAVFRFPSEADLCEKWVIALGKSFDWRPTGSQRICEVHFDQKDTAFVAKRKQLCKGVIPCYFCKCPYKEISRKNWEKSVEGIEEKEKRNYLNNQNKSSKRREDHAYSKRLEFTEHAYSQGLAKKFLSL